MKNIILVLLLSFLTCSCSAYKAPPEIGKAVELTRSAVEEDIAPHCLELSRVELGRLVSELQKEETREAPDPEKIRNLQERIALEKENIDALKELVLTLKDLEAWSKGE